MDLKKTKNGIIIKDDSIAPVYGKQEVDKIGELIHLVSEPLTSQQVSANPEILSDCQIVLTTWGSLCFDEKILPYAPNLELVLYGAGSIKAVVSDMFWDKGIKISSAYAANGVSVAQYTLSQILAASKHFYKYVVNTKQIKHFAPRNYYEVAGTYNSTVGIISLGMIGRLVCQYIQATTEMNIIAYDPFISKEQAKALGVELCSLEEVFKNSDIVSLHTPALEETEGMITGEHFKSMKQGSTFINTARGIVIREQEMIDVLKERSDITAVLDVTYPEPPSKDSPLYTMDNVLLTPHIGGCMGAECRRLSKYMIDELERYLAGEELKWLISRERSLILA